MTHKQDFNFLLTEINHTLTLCSVKVAVYLFKEIIHQNYTSMKNTFALLGVAGLAAWGLSSFSVYQKAQQAQPQMKRHIKITKIENGNKLELDTRLSGNNVFVWNGDTINPDKDSKKFSPSGFDKIHHPDGGGNSHKNIRIYQYGDSKTGNSTGWQSDPGKDVEIYSQDAGDLAQKKIIIHRRLKDGTVDDRIIYLKGPNGESFPPMPPIPSIPPMKMRNDHHGESTIDLNDPNIVSFRKKKLSGDREKIEIIRKKSEIANNMNVDYQMDDGMAIPEPPEPPVFMDEFNNDDTLKKQIRKQIRVEIKSDSIHVRQLPHLENK